MNEGLVPRRYAKALYGFALEKGVAERVYTMMKNLTASFAANGGLQPTLANPYVGASDKEALLVTAAGADKTDSAFADFLKLLAENRRLDWWTVTWAGTQLWNFRLQSIRRLSAASLWPWATSVSMLPSAMSSNNLDSIYQANNNLSR